MKQVNIYIDLKAPEHIILTILKDCLRLDFDVETIQNYMFVGVMPDSLKLVMNHIVTAGNTSKNIESFDFKNIEAANFIAFEYDDRRITVSMKFDSLDNYDKWQNLSGLSVNKP